MLRKIPANIICYLTREKKGFFVKGGWSLYYPLSNIGASLDLPQTKGVQSQEQDTSLNLVSAFSSFLLTETIQTVK